MEGSATAKRGWETMLRESSCEIAILEKLLRRRERRRGRPRGRRLVGEPGEKRKEGRKGVGRKEGGMDGWMDVDEVLSMEFIRLFCLAFFNQSLWGQ